MQTHYVILADAAETTRNGKLALLGGDIEVLRFTAFPTFVASLFAVISLTVNETEVGVTHVGQIEVTGPSSEVILPRQEFQFTPVRNPPETSALPVRFRFIVNLSGAVIPAPGKYVIRLVVGGSVAEDIPFLAIHVPSEQASYETHAVEQAEE